jgi:hypothetical protein
MSWTWSHAALAQQTPSKKPLVKAAPVDFRACNLREGKTRADLDEVAERFRAYANKNDSKYAAWILVPQYHSQSDFDVGWLGAWPDGESFGVSMERWMTSGQAIQAEFAEVVDCSNHHEMAASLPINAWDATPQDGILLVYQCSLAEGKDLEAAYAAHLEWGTAKKGLGFLDHSWMFQPTAGIRNIGFDYYHLVTFYRYSDLGAAMEVYANGGGMKKRDSIYDGVTDCGRPFIYDFTSVRYREER